MKKTFLDEEERIHVGEASYFDRLKKFLPILLPIAILVAGAYYFITVVYKQDTAVRDGEVLADVFVEVGEINANLVPTHGKNNSIRASFTLYLSNRHDVKVIQGKLPLIRDAFQVFLQQMRASDLSYSSGTFKLKEELLNRANKILYPTQIKEVLFKEIVIN